MKRTQLHPRDITLPNGIVVQATSPTPVVVKPSKGPAHADGEVSYHPNFKFTAGPSPKLGLRTNTHPQTP